MSLIREGQEGRPSAGGGPQGAPHPPIADGAPCERAAGRGSAWRAFRAQPGPMPASVPTACPAWPYVGAAPRRGSHQEPGCPRRQARPLLLVPALNPCLLQQLTVLLLRHPLAAFLDDRAHQAPLSSAQGRRACHHAHPRTGAGQTPEIRTDVNADRSRSPQDYLLPPGIVTVWSGTLTSDCLSAAAPRCGKHGKCGGRRPPWRPAPAAPYRPSA